MKNKRKHKRVHIAGSAVISFEQNGNPLSTRGMTGCISFGGIGLYADDFIEVGSNVSLEVSYLSGFGLRTASISGNVVYNKTLEHIYFMGIQFDEEIDPGNQPLLYEHIQRILSWDN